jgi:hypothetical protein
MKIAAAIALVALSASAFADDWKPLETVDQARQRQSAENYETYRNRGNEAPLGGYNQPLGSPSVPGVERPGYVAPAPIYQPSAPAAPQPYQGGDWRRGLR